MKKENMDENYMTLSTLQHNIWWIWNELNVSWSSPLSNLPITPILSNVISEITHLQQKLNCLHELHEPNKYTNLTSIIESTPNLIVYNFSSS
jgi:hypothetical protein